MEEGREEGIEGVKKGGRKGGRREEGREGGGQREIHVHVQTSCIHEGIFTSK